MEQLVLSKINTLKNTYNNQEIDAKEFIEEIKYYQQEDKIVMTVNALGDDQTINRQIEREIIRICKIDLGIKGVKISYSVAESTNDSEMKVPLTTKVIAVLSGKGGVGKSNIAYNLGLELSKQGHKTGIIDADIYGYSIPSIADEVTELEMEDKLICPQKINDNLEIISAHHFLPDLDNKAIIWRGMKLNSLLMHFVYDVKWSKDLEYLVIDMPPGTGDILLNINNLFDQLYGLYVTTPSKDAAFVAERIIQVGEELEFIPIGLIENMAYYLVDGKKHYIFGKDGAKILSEKYNLDIIQSIPIGEQLTTEYQQLANKVDNFFK